MPQLRFQLFVLMLEPRHQSLQLGHPRVLLLERRHLSLQLGNARAEAGRLRLLLFIAVLIVVRCPVRISAVILGKCCTRTPWGGGGGGAIGTCTAAGIPANS